MSQPRVAQKGPYRLTVEPNMYAWCACGQSKNQPYCDGSHRGTGFQPIVIKIEERKTVAWCGCKHSQNKPFCDGSHNQLP